MLGACLGLMLGLIELWLLKKLADGICADGKIPIWAMPLSILAMPVFLVPVAFIRQEELTMAGICAAAGLIIGAVVLTIKAQRAERSGK